MSKWLIIATTVVTLMFSWVLHDWRMMYVNKQHADELKAQEKSLLAECDVQKEEIYAVSDKYQKTLSANRAELARLKRLHNNTTCVVPTNAASGPDAKTPNAGLSGANGITVEALLDFGADAEDVALQLDACQDWLERQRVND